MKYIWTGHMCAVAAYGVCGTELWTPLLNTLRRNSKMLVRAHSCTLNICLEVHVGCVIQHVKTAAIVDNVKGIAAGGDNYIVNYHHTTIHLAHYSWYGCSLTRLKINMNVEICWHNYFR